MRELRFKECDLISGGQTYVVVGTAPKVTISNGKATLTCPEGTTIQVVRIGNVVAVGCTPKLV